MMRSESVTPAGGPRSDAPPRDDATASAEAAQDGFEAALRRAGRGRRGFGDEPDPHDAGAAEPNATPLQAAWPAPASPRVDAPATRWAPQAATAPDAVTRQLQAQALPDAGLEPGRWQLQLTDTALPVQRMELQRTPAGPVTVLVSALNEAPQPRHQARLRERLAPHGARADFRGPSTEQEP